MTAPGTDEPAKALLPFLQRADELQRHDPLIAYYCRMHAMEQGLKVPSSQRSNEFSELLMSLLNQLEKDKATVKRSPDDNLYVEGFAQRVFDKADRQDRAGKADISTAKSFYAAGIFFEVASQFGTLAPELEQKQKYAIWKAGDIRKALKEGRTPTPGPPGGDDNIKKMFGSDAAITAAPSLFQAPSFSSNPSNQPIPSLDAFGLPHAPSQSPSLTGLPVAMPVQGQGYPQAQHQYGHTGSAAVTPPYAHPPSTYSQPQASGYPSATGQGMGYPSTSATGQMTGAAQGYNPSAYNPSTSSYLNPANPTAPSAPSGAFSSSPYAPSSTAGSSYSSQNPPGVGASRAALYDQAAASYYSTQKSSGVGNGNGPLSSTPNPSAPPVEPSALSGALNGTAGLSLAASVAPSAPPNTPAATSGFGYTQPPPGKVAEAHKAARFAVSSLAFDDVPTAIEYLKKALDVLTKS